MSPKGLLGSMFRLAKKKSGPSLYWTIVLVFLICLLTAFFYYFVLIDELELKPKTVVNSEDLEKQINYRLSGLELGLKQNRDILKNIRFKLDKVIKDFNGDLNKESDDESDSDLYADDPSICADSESHKSIYFVLLSIV